MLLLRLVAPCDDSRPGSGGTSSHTDTEGIAPARRARVDDAARTRGIGGCGDSRHAATQRGLDVDDPALRRGKGIWTHPGRTRV